VQEEQEGQKEQEEQEEQEGQERQEELEEQEDQEWQEMQEEQQEQEKEEEAIRGKQKPSLQSVNFKPSSSFEVDKLRASKEEASYESKEEKSFSEPKETPSSNARSSTQLKMARETPANEAGETGPQNLGDTKTKKAGEATSKLQQKEAGEPKRKEAGEPKQKETEEPKRKEAEKPKRKEAGAGEPKPKEEREPKPKEEREPKPKERREEKPKEGREPKPKQREESWSAEAREAKLRETAESLLPPHLIGYPPSFFKHKYFDPDATIEPVIDRGSIEKWRLRERLIHGALVVAVANSAHLNFTLNFREYFTASGYDPQSFFVFCLDEVICEDLGKHSIPSARIPDSWVSGNLETFMEAESLKDEGVWFDKEAKYKYFAITHAKAAVVYQLLLQGFTILLTDVDIVFPRRGWIEHMVGKFKSNPDALLQICFEGHGIKNDFYFPYVNSGFYIVRPHPLMVRMFELITANQISRNDTVDQFIFNEVLDQFGMKMNGPRRNLIIFLDRDLFATGWSYFIHKIPQGKGIVPYMIHANYVGGKGSKEKNLKDFGLWKIPP